MSAQTWVAAAAVALIIGVIFGVIEVKHRRAMHEEDEIRRQLKEHYEILLEIDTIDLTMHTVLVPVWMDLIYHEFTLIKTELGWRLLADLRYPDKVLSVAEFKSLTVELNRVRLDYLERLAKRSVS